MEKAVLSLALAGVSPIITKFGEAAASYFGGDISQKELRYLQTNIIPKIQTVIQQTEKIDAPTLKPWLMELQAAAYEAEDLLDMYEYNKIKNDVSGLPASLKKVKGKAKEMLVPLLLKTDLKKSVEKLKQSADEADKLIPLLNLVHSTITKEDIAIRSHAQQRITVSRLSSPVFGRDQECNALVNMLITEPNDSSSVRKNVTTHAIHGIGGAGKTTLAQRVYNAERLKDHFGLKIWIHVSRTFDTYRITKEIIEAIEKGSCSPVGNLDALQNKLKELLKSKRFLLVLDDVWTEDRQLWDLLLLPLYEGTENGSRILMTTRMEKILRIAVVKNENIISLNELRIEDCRSVFKYYAFDDANKAIEDPEVADICEKILRKLRNSPLAARLTGSLLNQSARIVGACRRILNSDLLGGTLDVILLSFQHLPPHLQRCFALCSLYPKGWNYYDCNIHKREYYNLSIYDLVRLWIAHGYVEAAENESLEDKGRQYFDDLLSYSLFQIHPTYKDCYVMHDLVHDASEMVSKNYCFRVEGDDPINIPATVVHLSVASGELDIHMSNILELINLRTFVILSANVKVIDFSEQIVTMFNKLRKLRVLQFWRWQALGLNNSVGQLKHLRHLQLKAVERLPELLGTLYHLLYLDVGESSIIEVPKSLDNLVNLQRLFPTSLYPKIENIGKLVSLQELKANWTKEHGLQQLRNLQQIKGSLKIVGLENIESKPEAMDAMLNKKRHLDKLILTWDRDVDVDMNRDVEVVEGLEPHPNLKELEIYRYRGAKLPSWIGTINSTERLSNLTSLKLCFCYNLIEISQLPGLLKIMFVGKCPNLMGILSLSNRLKWLLVEECPKLKTLSPYPCSLESLIIRDCLGVEGLLSSANDDDRNESFCLKKFDISRVSIIDEKSLNGFLINNRLNSLSYLRLHCLTSITSIHLGPHLETLRHLHIDRLENLLSIKAMEYLTSLDSISVTRCSKLTQTMARAGRCIPSHIGEAKVDDLMVLLCLFQEHGLNSLVHLEINEWSQDVALSAEQEGIFLHLTSLKGLVFEDCEKLPSLPGTLEKLSSLKLLNIRYCYGIESLPSLPSSLSKLNIFCCDEMESLPNLPSSLSELYIMNCHPRLKAKYKEGGPLRHHIDHIPTISIW